MEVYVRVKSTDSTAVFLLIADEGRTTQNASGARAAHAHTSSSSQWRGIGPGCAPDSQAGQHQRPAWMADAAVGLFVLHVSPQKAQRPTTEAGRPGGGGIGPGGGTPYGC